MREPVQTPTQFTHPVTGAKMGKSEIGDTFEHMFVTHAAHLLEKKYGAAYQPISVTGGFSSRTTPLDFRIGKYGGELKTLNSNARNQKTAIKAEEIERKRAAVAKDDLQPLLIVQVVDMDRRHVTVWSYPDFASKAVSKMDAVGEYDFSLEDFTHAQKLTGHADRAVKAADEDDVSIEPGDLVITLVDGVPHIQTEPDIKKRVALADVVKVGPEGYIHGYICVRPPCGPKYKAAEVDKRKGTVSHDGVKIGKVPSKDTDGKYSAIHYKTDAAGVAVREKLPARFDTAQQAFDAIPLYHNISRLAEQDTTPSVGMALDDARSAFARGDAGIAADHLSLAVTLAKNSGQESLSQHIDHVRGVIRRGEADAEIAALPEESVVPSGYSARWDQIAQDGPQSLVMSAEDEADQVMTERHPDRIFGGPNGNVPEGDPLWEDRAQLALRAYEFLRDTQPETAVPPPVVEPAASHGGGDEIRADARVTSGKKTGKVVSHLVSGGFYVRWDGGKKQVWVTAEKLKPASAEAPVDWRSDVAAAHVISGHTQHPEYVPSDADHEVLRRGYQAARDNIGLDSPDAQNLKRAIQRSAQRRAKIARERAAGGFASIAEWEADLARREQEQVARTPIPHVPAAPQRVISHSQLDAQQIAAELQHIDVDGRNVTGVPSYNSPVHSTGYLAQQLRRGQDHVLYPREPRPGEHAPAESLRSIDRDLRSVDWAIANKKPDEYSVLKEPIPPAGIAELRSIRDRLQSVRDRVAAADTSSRFEAGDFTSDTRSALAGGFDEHLGGRVVPGAAAPDAAQHIKQLIRMTNLSFPEDELYSTTHGKKTREANLNQLKHDFITRAVAAAGLPENAGAAVADEVASRIGDWSLSGQQADDVIQKYERGMTLAEPPVLRVTDFAGRHNTGDYLHGDDAKHGYSDMSPDAAQRRRNALSYWAARAQQHYTDQVLKETGQHDKPLKVIRYVYGDYARNILNADREGRDWQADARLLSSWAEPKGSSTAKVFVRMFTDEKKAIKPTAFSRGMTAQPASDFARLEQQIQPDQVFAHWRGESTLRNGVKVKGEIITRRAEVNSAETKVTGVA
jgi:hypothetical protein